VTPDNPVLFQQALVRRSFEAFIAKAWPWITGGEPIKWNWHIEAIAWQLENVASGELRRLIAAIPPRYGKSKIVSVIWVAWMLGQDPSQNFVCVSYSNELSGKLARDCLAIMQAPWYREVFPKTLISSKRSASGDFETTAGGGRLATSVTGTLTGRGGDIIILDDVIKPSDANSETARNSVNNWYQSTLESRLNDKGAGAIILVMQRLHENDIAGMLIDAGGWHLLKLPAIATEDEIIPLTRGRLHQRKVGDLLHPEREPADVLDRLKEAIGSATFAAQYQQEPVPASGNTFKRQWFKSFDLSKAAPRRGTIVQSWDTASKDNPHNDWSVCVTARVLGKDIYILDVQRGRLQIPDLKDRAIAIARQHMADVLLIEDHASGTQLLQILASESPRGVPSPISCRPESDKISRALGVAAMIEGGRVHLPIEAPWLADFLRELLGFPNSRFDDQVDALSQLLGWARTQDAFLIAPRVMQISRDDSDFPAEDFDEEEGPNSYFARMILF